MYKCQHISKSRYLFLHELYFYISVSYYVYIYIYIYSSCRNKQRAKKYRSGQKNWYPIVIIWLESMRDKK